ncbi:hypothetical protein CDLVIII_2721 [Clostridium sp. DL-VIII]|uniref:hypothetical protein n=1 Tax=Clostridium sp. DL-VIII TaxID=641107 RepID=UPI00023AF93B|nr:hypothetical protein [Clostridium sp. DL-VIII]EHI99321.1 hypothetical protein CDLVIII_2721 [Clostridium sp. DL-VIII]
MEATMTLNTLQKNRYNNLSFWENEIIKNNNLWEGYFDNKGISKDSKIVYTGILDVNKNILQCGWAVYPCIYSLLGFLKYVYLPTSFFIWFDRKSDNLYIPMLNFDTIINKTLKFNDSSINLESVNSMKKTYDLLNDLWSVDYDLLISKLNIFCDTFNNTWDNHSNQKLFIKVFNNPRDTFSFVKNSIEQDSKDLIEEDISMTFDAFKFACDNAIEEPLLNKRFIDILNTNAPILF